jgi:DNA repair exonuclease SbcCD ATPase subunit
MSEDINWNDIESKAGSQVKINAQIILDLREEIKAANSERDDFKAQIEKMQAQFEQQSNQIEKLGADLKKASAKPTEDVGALKTKITMLQTDVSSKAQFIAQLEQDVADARVKAEEAAASASGGVELDELKAKVDELQQQLDEKEFTIAGLKDDVDRTQQQVDEKDATIAGLKDDVDRAQQQAAEAQEKASAVGGEQAGEGGPDAEAFAKEKEDFELEKKRLFKEMEDFEVGLRTEMEKKDEKIAELEAQVEQGIAPPAPSIQPSPKRDVAPKASPESLAPSGGPSRERLAKKLGPDSDAIAKPSKILAKQTAAKAETVAATTRIVCPKCGNKDLKVENDKSKVLTYTDGVPIYAKKYVCKRCMNEFRVD